MEYFYFEFDGISSRNYNLTIQNNGEDLSFPAQANFENHIVTPLYQDASYLAGVSKTDREFKFNCWVNSLSIDTVRAMLTWLSVDKISYLILDYNPNFKYQVKIQSLSDLKHLSYNEDGTTNYEFQISFTTIGENSALSVDSYHITESEYLAILNPTPEDVLYATPRGINKDNGGPITFRDPYDLIQNPLNPTQQIGQFKVFNYYSLPFETNITIEGANGISVISDNIPYYNYVSFLPQTFTIESKNGFVKIGDSLAENVPYTQANLNLGKMSIPAGNTQTLITELSNVTYIAPDPIQHPEIVLPYYITVQDTNEVIYYENIDNLYIIVQDGSYGENSTQSYDPIDREDYIYNKINKDGSNSNIDILNFNHTDILSTTSPGQLFWNRKFGTFDMSLYNNVSLQVGQELLFYVTAQYDVYAGQPVMFSNYDFVNQKLFVKPSVPEELLISGYFYVGVPTKDILAGEVGYVTLFGIVDQLNFLNLVYNPAELVNWTSGTVLYIDPYHNGKLTSIAPQSPQLKIIVGAIMIPDVIDISNPLNPISLKTGQVIISTTQGVKVESLYNVSANSAVNGDTLVYRDGVWNAEASTSAAGGITVQDEAQVFAGTNVEEVLKELFDVKVEKVSGYSLLSDAEIAKLSTVQMNAEENVQADWNETDPASDAFIVNKPIIAPPYELPYASTSILGGVRVDGVSVIANEYGVISAVGAGSGSVTSVTGITPISVATGTTTPVISINAATTTTPGAMTAADKTKLDSIATGAEVNVQSDWNETNINSDAYIRNKPLVPTQYTDEMAQDAVGGILTDSTSINLTYDDGLNVIKADAIFGNSAGTITEGNDPRLSDARTPIAHTHGNISNLGQIGAISNLVVTTGANGVLTTSSRAGIDSRTEYPPSSHTHTISQITNLVTTLEGKAKAPSNEFTSLNGQILTSNGDGTFTYYNNVAAKVTTVDAANYFTSSTVEGNLQELGAKDVYLKNLLLLSSATGVYEFGGITKVTDTTITIGAAKGYIVDNTTDPENPTILHIEYAGTSSPITSPYIGSTYQTQIFLQSDGTLYMNGSDQPPCPVRRDYIFLGRIVHPETIITGVENVPDYVQSPASQLRDLWKGLGVINDKNYVYPNNTPSTNLSLALHGGTLYYNGINFTVNPKRPSRKDITSQSLLSFGYRLRTGVGTNNVTVLDPTKWDNNGVLTDMPAVPNYSSNQRIYLTSAGNIVIQYGQHVYQTLQEAIAGLATESFSTASAIEYNAILIDVISIRRGATDLTSANANFHLVSRFGEISGSSGGGGVVGAAIDVTFSPVGNISSTNVQAAIQELDTEKAPKANPVLSGTVIIGDISGTNVSIGSDNIKVYGNTVWHAGNDGEGSGLDADTVDGKHASINNTANSIPVRDSNGNLSVTNTYNYGADAYTKYNSTTKSIDFIFI